ncbi:MAG TPA: sulfite exporter TauE/SafE family protein [Gammaproteobacteria bacterium]|jgi:uncharacterized protein|nr:sulfite exporter TauE/SafE family protein [Gammaproteobacteria bacterium]
MFELAFTFIAFFTSMLTAIIGLGGGLLLIALMPGFLPTAVIIPIHSVVQLASNASRAAFAWRAIRWEYFTAFAIGSIIGGLIATQFIRLINIEYISLFIGLFILMNVWTPKIFEWLGRLKGEFFTIGILQTGLGMIGGATGPLGQASLMRRDLSKDEIVTTTALFMSFTHITKLFAFAILGVNLLVWWKLMFGMVVGVILGSWAGTKVRTKVNDAIFKQVLSVLLTILAIRMIYAVVF